MALSAAIFSNLLPRLLSELPKGYKEHVYVHQDDTLVAANETKEVQGIVSRILRILDKRGSKVNPDKSFIEPVNRNAKIPTTTPQCIYGERTTGQSRGAYSKKFTSEGDIETSPGSISWEN